MKIHDLEQQSKEWFDIRKGKITCSKAQAIGNNGKGLETYVNEIMSEHYSSQEKEHFTNEHTERGNELESLAREMYELETGNKVSQVGFIEYNDYIGGSPDGLISEDGLIEIKCPDDKNFFKILWDEKLPSEYVWQCQMLLLITERKWIDLAFYNPNFKKSLLIYRQTPDEEKFEQLKLGFKKADEYIKLIKSKLKNL